MFNANSLCCFVTNPLSPTAGPTYSYLNETSLMYQWLHGLGPLGILGNSIILVAWISAHL